MKEKLTLKSHSGNNADSNKANQLLDDYVEVKVPDYSDSEGSKPTEVHDKVNGKPYEEKHKVSELPKEDILVASIGEAVEEGIRAEEELATFESNLTQEIDTFLEARDNPAVSGEGPASKEVDKNRGGEVEVLQAESGESMDKENIKDANAEVGAEDRSTETSEGDIAQLQSEIEDIRNRVRNSELSEADAHILVDEIEEKIKGLEAKDETGEEESESDTEEMSESGDESNEPEEQVEEKGGIETEEELKSEDEKNSSEVNKPTQENKAEQLQQLKSEFESLGFSYEKLEEELDGFVDLSSGQKLLVAENLKQLGYLKLSEQSADAYDAETAEGRKFKETKNGQKLTKLSYLREMWRGLNRGRGVIKNEQKNQDEVMRAGEEGFGEDIAALVEAAKQGPGVTEVVDEKGNRTLQIEYATGFENVNSEQQEVVNEFNQVATKLARLPQLWGTEDATWNQRRKYNKVQEEYQQKKLALVGLELESNEDQIAAQRLDLTVDQSVYMNQHFNTYPDIEKKLNHLSQKPAFALAIGNFVKEQGVLMSVGAVSRNLTTMALGGAAIASGAGILAAGAGVAAGAMVGSALGGFRGSKKEKAAFAKEAEAARRSDLKGVREMQKKSETTREMKNVTNLTDRLQDTIDAYKEETDPEKRSKWEERLKIRINNATSAAREGLVIHGKGAQGILNLNGLYKTIADAKIALFEGNSEAQEEYDRQIDSFIFEDLEAKKAGTHDKTGRDRSAVVRLEDMQKRQRDQREVAEKIRLKEAMKAGGKMGAKFGIFGALIADAVGGVRNPVSDINLTNAAKDFTNFGEPDQVRVDGGEWRTVGAEAEAADGAIPVADDIDADATADDVVPQQSPIEDPNAPQHSPVETPDAIDDALKGTGEADDVVPQQSPIEDPNAPQHSPVNSPDAIDDALKGTGEAAEEKYEFKPIEVEASSKGAIQTFVDLKAQLRLDYPDVDTRPPMVEELLSEDASKLAERYGFYNPDAVDESSMILKGESLRLSEDGALEYAKTNGEIITLEDGQDLSTVEGSWGDKGGTMFDYDAVREAAAAEAAEVQPDAAGEAIQQPTATAEEIAARAADETLDTNLLRHLEGQSRTLLETRVAYQNMYGEHVGRELAEDVARIFKAHPEHIVEWTGTGFEGDRLGLRDMDLNKDILRNQLHFLHRVPLADGETMPSFEVPGPDGNTTVDNSAFLERQNLLKIIKKFTEEGVKINNEIVTFTPNDGETVEQFLVRAHGAVIEADTGIDIKSAAEIDAEIEQSLEGTVFEGMDSMYDGPEDRVDDLQTKANYIEKQVSRMEEQAREAGQPFDRAAAEATANENWEWGQDQIAELPSSGKSIEQLEAEAALAESGVDTSAVSENAISSAEETLQKQGWDAFASAESRGTFLETAANVHEQALIDSGRFVENADQIPEIAKILAERDWNNVRFVEMAKDVGVYGEVKIDIDPDNGVATVNGQQISPEAYDRLFVQPFQSAERLADAA